MTLPTLPRARISWQFLLAAVVLLLNFWATHIVAIDQFPMFTDEAFHVRYARNVIEKGPLYRASAGRVFAVWLFALTQADANAAILVSRVTSVLAVLPGVAALIASGSLLAGRWGGVLVGILLILSPYHLFFERLALADPASASAISLALYFTIRLVRRVSFQDAMMVGVMIFIAFGAKVSALPFLALPVAGVLFLNPRQRTLGQSVGWLVVGLGVGCALTFGYLALAAFRGYNPLFHLLRGTGQAGGSAETVTLLLNRIPRNIGNNVINLSGFLGVAGVALLLVALVILVWQRRWFLPALVAGSMAVFWLNTRADTRHIMASVNIAFVGAGVVLGGLMRGRSRQFQWGVLAIIVVIGLVVWLPFATTLYTNPLGLSLSADEYQQYLASEGSGSGLPELAATLADLEPDRILGIFANCWALDYLAGDRLHLECQSFNPDGSTVDTLSEVMANNRTEGVYAVLENLVYLPSDPPGQLVATIPRPAPGPALQVYDLAPD